MPRLDEAQDPPAIRAIFRSGRVPFASSRRAEVLSRVTGPLESLVACGVARRSAPDVIDLYLGEAESAPGGMATISMNMALRCPHCAEQKTAMRCARCASTGKVQERFSGH